MLKKGVACEVHLTVYASQSTDAQFWVSCDSYNATQFPNRVGHMSTQFVLVQNDSLQIL
jgi:hypothetical protein